MDDFWKGVMSGYIFKGLGSEPDPEEPPGSSRTTFCPNCKMKTEHRDENNRIWTERGYIQKSTCLVCNRSHNLWTDEVDQRSPGIFSEKIQRQQGGLISKATNSFGEYFVDLYKGMFEMIWAGIVGFSNVFFLVIVPCLLLWWCAELVT